MRKKDEFDDPRDEGAIASIFRTLDVRQHLEARGPLFTVGPMVLMGVLLVGVLWYSYPKEAERQELEAAPIVRADAGEYKTAPDDPGGMDVPYRESTVFDTLRNKREGDGGVENLLPETEKPVDRREMFAGLKAEPPEVVDAEVKEKSEVKSASVEPVTAADDDIETSIPQEAVPVPEKLPMEQANPPAPPPMPQPVLPQKPVVEAAPVETVTAVKAEDVVKTEPAAGMAAGGDHYVQLGALRSRADAEAGWKKFQADFPAELKPLGVRIQEANLGEKGMFYRVQGGPLTQDKAKSICAALQAKKPGSCMVVKK